MKLPKLLPELVFILLAACLCVGLVHPLRTQPPQAQITPTEPAAVHLDLSGAPVDLAVFDAYPRLDSVDLSGTGLSREEYALLREMYPDCQILWDIPYQDSFYPADTTSITVTTLDDADVEFLDGLTKLEHIFAWNCRDYDRLLQLQRRHPDAAVYYNVESAAGTYSPHSTRITAPGNDPETLAQIIPYLPRLESVTLTQPLAEGARLSALREQYPQIQFHWELEFMGKTIGTDTTQLDLSGIPTSVEELEPMLAYMPNLTRLEMTGCGISHEELDALNRRHETVKIVWTVYVGRIAVKTDATWFMPAKYYMEVNNADIYNLRYCTDMECIDLGHMKISNCEFAAYMPHLKYLMLADTKISDLTPLTGLKELIYLELFMTPVKDYTPLTTLTALEDLNLYFTYGDWNTLTQMPWLKNLWWRHVDTTDEAIRGLTEALPDTNVVCVYGSSTGNGWRKLPNYFAQRDIFGMEYMTE